MFRFGVSGLLVTMGDFVVGKNSVKRKFDWQNLDFLALQLYITFTFRRPDFYFRLSTSPARRL